MHKKSFFPNKQKLQEAIAIARGSKKADLVFKDASFLDVFSGQFIHGDLAVFEGMIIGTCDSYEGKQEISCQGQYIVPGFIDSHVHIESCLMTPQSFSDAVLPCGTTTAIWDPHEIANVKGIKGIEWALAASEGLALDIFVMLPSCVPSTSLGKELETSGAILTAEDLITYKDHPRVLGLAEMMNFPGLLTGEDDVMDKLIAFNQLKRDGHCPSLVGKDLNAYGVSGIHSCHESTGLMEAKEKLVKGLHVLIREGSCAKNANELLPLLDAYSSAVICLCTDDRNPLDVRKEGHINHIIELALKNNHPPQDIFRAASFAAARAYGLDDRGVLAPGYKADLCLLKLKDPKTWRSGFNIIDVYKAGKKISNPPTKSSPVSSLDFFSGKNLNLSPLNLKDLSLVQTPYISSTQKVRVIEVIPGQILTNEKNCILKVHSDGQIKEDLQADILKITVVERHHQTGRRGLGFVNGFGLKEGAIASSINHDSHNIIAVGTSDEAILGAINHLISIDGGIVVWRNKQEHKHLHLAIGGLMSDENAEFIATKLEELKKLTRSMGCSLYEPFLQLSFLALPVIPSLKITDRGLVDVGQFKIVPVLI